MASPVGGLDLYSNIDLDETGILVKAGQHSLYGGYIYNSAATVRFVKFYDKATAAVVGTNTPVLVLPVPAGSGAVFDFGSGVAFQLGLSVGSTTGVANNDTGAPAANDVIVNLFYR